MNKTCRQCKSNFEITGQDLKFYEKISPVFNGKKFAITPPGFCPTCRQLRRLVHANQINLYPRKCDATGEEIISNYHSDVPYKVYKQEYWWGDQWDPLAYGRDFDFSRSFFDQYQELLLAVPRPSLFTGYQYDENSDYTNFAGKNKNCYLLFDADYCRDTYYSYGMNTATNCIDCYRVRQSELCYENVDCKNCYNTKYLTNCSNCMDSAFLDNCYGCKNCFMSFNLQHKEYYIYNKPSTKEEYEKFMNQLSSQKSVEKFKEEYKKLKNEYPKKYMHGIQNERVSGDYMSNCKNVRESFDCNDSWDCSYIYQSFGTNIKDCMDCDEPGEFAELLYESTNSGYNATNLKFCLNALDQNSDLLYCNQCHFSNNLFGCVSLKRKKYCILNKQYTPEEYGKMVARIIEHMQKNDGASGQEWAEFFPPKLSTCAYNESMAMDYAPLTKEQALKFGFQWRDDDKKKMPQTALVPDDIRKVQPTITREILACVECKSNFKIIPQELKFYQERVIPLPTKCFKCRHYDRLKSRNPRKLFERKCDNCHLEIQTTYEPNRPEKIYCEKCYQEIVI